MKPYPYPSPSTLTKIRTDQMDGQVHQLGIERRKTLSHQQGDWTGELNSRLNILCALPVGWDGYSGKPVLYDLASYGAQILQTILTPGAALPSIVPLGTGGLQIEWHEGELDIEITISQPFEADVWVLDEADPEKPDGVETNLTQDFSYLTPFLDRINAKAAASERQFG